MMALLGFATLLAIFGVFAAIMAVRYRQGRAEHLRRQPYHGSLWPAARRNIAFGLLPIAGICFVVAATMTAEVAGVDGPILSAAFLLLVLALVATLVVFMVTRPRWLGPSADHPADPATGSDQADQPPRPVSEMTPQELADWAGGDPEKLRRLMRRRRF
jgi:Kef-type K+ transport system membrane component KefB